MKVLLLTLSLTLLASCGGKSGGTESELKAVSSEPVTEEAYDLPTIGFRRSISLNYRFESVYERMTLNPSSDNNPPGIKPFLLFMTDTDKLHLDYYSDQDIKKVSYIDYGDVIELAGIKSADKSILQNPRVRPVKDFARSFTYGENSFDFPEQDMKGKVFIVESEAVDLPDVSHMTVMFWIESGSDGLRFNYKLLDFRLLKAKD